MTTITRAERAEQTRQLILDTAHRLIRSNGYDATSLQMIADDMGLTKAAVYYHFRTKAEILLAIAAGPIGSFNQLLDEAAAAGSRRQRTEIVVRGLVDVLLNAREMSGVKESDPGIRRELQESGLLDDTKKRGLQVLFGDTPSPEEVLAFNLLLHCGELVSELGPISDDELRTTLTRTYNRILRVRTV